MTIYKLMNKVARLRFYLTLASQTYQEGKEFYWVYEHQCEAILETLKDLGYIKYEEYDDLRNQMYHIMRVFKRTNKKK